MNANQIKDRPILFSSAMVRAILDGRKTQTRRVVKPQPRFATGCPCCTEERFLNSSQADRFSSKHWGFRCPYGDPGDHLWVRETWVEYDDVIFFKADENMEKFKWRPSIHMPLRASRITLEITDVRVERLQDISEEDAKEEGVGGKDTVTVSPITTKTYKQAFSIFWDNMHVGAWKNKVHKNGSRWTDNPWVWVVCFRRVNP